MSPRTPQHTTKRQQRPATPSAAEVMESHEAAVEIARRSVKSLPALSAIIISRTPEARASLRGQVASAERWASSIAAELARGDLKKAPRSAQLRCRELAGELEGLMETIRSCSERMQQIWAAPSGSPDVAPRLPKQELCELFNVLAERRHEFWARLHSFPFVAARRTAELKRCLEGELKIASAVFRKPTDARSGQDIVGEIRAAVSFLEEKLQAPGVSSSGAWPAWQRLGRLLSSLPPLPEEAIELSSEVQEKGRCLIEASRSHDDGLRAGLESELGGTASETSARIGEMLAVRDEYIALKSYIYAANAALGFVLGSSKRDAWHVRDDVLQAARLALLKAIERFDPGLKRAFSTYASYWAEQLTTEERNGIFSSVRVPLYARASYAALIRLPEEELRALDAAAIAERHQLSLATARALLRMATGIKRIGDVPGPSGTVLNLAAQLGDRGESEAQQIFGSAENRELADKLLACLSERERHFVRLRFGIGHETQMTLEEIGNQAGITRERARQVLAGALKTMRWHWERQRG